MRCDNCSHFNNYGQNQYKRKKFFNAFQNNGKNPGEKSVNSIKLISIIPRLNIPGVKLEVEGF